MDLYLDSADIAAWDALLPLGHFTGITTNPLLAARAGLRYDGIDWLDLAQRAAGHGMTELHAQVFGPPEGYLAWAAGLQEIGAKACIRMVIKVPLVAEASRIVPTLKKAGCPILMTACYHAKQMFIATGLGADYIAPYYGRMAEAGLPADQHMADMLSIAAQADVTTRVLAASLRNTDQMLSLARMGCDCFTISPDVARDLLTEDLSQNAYAEFEAAASA